MDRVMIVLFALLAVARCQLLQQTNVNSNSDQTGGAAGFKPINGDFRASDTNQETSSVQSRDYSGGESDFYGYNYPPSYGPPSSSYGSSGKQTLQKLTIKTKNFKNPLN